MDAVEIEAPVVAVTVYPDRARVTRRGGTRLTAGEHRIRIAPLPLRLRRDSLRIGGGGAVTVLGVEVSTWRQPRSTDGQVGELTRRARELADELAEVDDDAEVETQRRQFLTRLAERAGSTYARTLAAGDTGPTDVATFADSVAAQLAESHRRRRGLARRRTALTEDLSAVERELAAAGGKQEPDRLAAEVTVAVDAGDTEVDLELSYLVDGARWESSYDLRLVEETMTVTWFGLVTQDTGEDWPECALQLSTARPAAAADVPELSPWYLDRVRRAPAPADLPVASFGAPPPPAPGAAPAGGGVVARGGAPRPAIRQAVAEVAQGVSAATYRPARPVAVPADGSAYRAVIAVLDLPVRLDHVTVPVRVAEAHLRATVRNTSAHTLLPGAAAVFHEADFVAATRLPTWAPGEETELALGVDDRVRVERELTRRADTRATLGSTRRRDVEYRISVANHTPRPATVEVRDQLPVSRDEAVAVRESTVVPPPDERTELGELTWRLRLGPGESGQITLGFRVELGKGVELAGWRE